MNEDGNCNATKMRIPTLQTILFFFVLFGAASAGRRHYQMLRQKCCANPSHNLCRVALERWHLCQEARKKGQHVGKCGDFGQHSDFARIACRPGIDGPPDWKDEEKPKA
ncbi:hypothetical protein CTA2_5235 [Colletotrichum tanaceti]|uniref:Uncharacterized protein n=1 Tax=Colletotrichum tanaceti TaxID=1306861 RepID=A0A4U6XQR4_9PEZI|nr:hypothetical protein CTA2_5235 [Colletotrichum tanaceti]TKW58154.1 hypothetical protein CTA1_7885 [Colletotrichum tanaceti]